MPENTSHMLLSTDKRGAIGICRALLAQGVDAVVICPGSRNAPLIRAFVDLGFQTYSVPDERSAAFVAMGMAQVRKRAVAVCCTSGSASTNFYPAVVEAYYQRIPLVVVTADRPANQVDVGDGQAIHQPGLYAAHVVREIHFDGEDAAPGTLPEVIDAAHQEHGPVHINISFQEPLYQSKEWEQKDALAVTGPVKELASFQDEVTSKRTLVICGQDDPDAQVKSMLERLALDNKAVVMSELLSNQESDQFISAIDRLVLSLTEEEKADWMPKRVVTLGGALVSRLVKAWLRQGAIEHVQLGTRYPATDVFTQGVKKVENTAAYLEALLSCEADPDFHEFFTGRDEDLSRMQARLMSETTWSDMKDTQKVNNSFRDGDLVHLANSSLVRYFLLHGPTPGVEYVGNRGVSGIDGSWSTAVGQALASPERTVYCVLGDMSAVYDSNAMWNGVYPANLRVILLDNGGGDIFRIIPGPRSYEGGEQFQACHHPVDYLKLAEAYGLKTRSCASEEELESLLPSLRAGEFNLLRVDTSEVENHEVILNYFEKSRGEQRG